MDTPRNKEGGEGMEMEELEKKADGECKEG